MTPESRVRRTNDELLLAVRERAYGIWRFPSPSRLFVLLCAALVAAAIADPLVESVSNSGVLGGHYDDDNHLGVVPVLLVGIALAATILFAHCARILRSSAGGSRDWLVDTAKDISARAPLQDLPALFALQLAALYALEATEQLLVGGDVGTMAWLGGPLTFSLLVHGLTGAGCMFLLGALMRAILRTFASLAYHVLHLAWIARAHATPTLHLISERRLHARAQSPHVRQIGGRAPPLHHAPAFVLVG